MRIISDFYKNQNTGNSMQTVRSSNKKVLKLKCQNCQESFWLFEDSTSNDELRRFFDDFHMHQIFCE